MLIYFLRELYLIFLFQKIFPNLAYSLGHFLTFRVIFNVMDQKHLLKLPSIFLVAPVDIHFDQNLVHHQMIILMYLELLILT